MPRPLGMLEWDGVAVGLRAADALLKQAPVTARILRPVSPGRYIALFEGDVESVRAALARGVEGVEPHVVDELFLAAPHADLLPSIGGLPDAPEAEAIGVLETLSLCSLLLAADAGAKAARVRLLETRLAMGLGGKAFTIFSGEISEVQEALGRGEERARERGYFLASSLIARPDPQIVGALRRAESPFRDLDA